MKTTIHVLPTILLFGFAGCSATDQKNAGDLNPGTPGQNTAVYIPDTPRNADPVNALSPTSADNANRGGQLRSATLAAVPAPDNSTFTATADKAGNFMEVREFKENPDIIKVERKIIGRDSKFLVYLKNGKVVEAPADKMNNFRTLAPINILEAIGANPAKVPATNQPAKPAKEL